MKDNREFDKETRSKIGPERMKAPAGAWKALDADLDKHRAAMLQRKANRLRAFSIVLVLLLLSTVGWLWLRTGDISQQAMQTDAPSTAHKSSPRQAPAPAASAEPAGRLQSGNAHHAVAAREPVAASSDPAQPVQSGTAIIPPASLTQNPGASIPNKSQAITLAAPSPENNETASPVVQAGLMEEQVSYMMPLTSIAAPTPESPAGLPVTSIPVPALPEGSDSRFAIGVSLAPEISWYHLKDNTADNFDDAAMYHGREESDFSFSTSLQLHYSFNDRWSLVSGIRYTSLVKSMTIPHLVVENGPGTGMQLAFTTSNGNVSMPFDDSYPSMLPGDSLAMNAACKQWLRMIHVPLAVQWQSDNTRINWHVKAGGSVDLVAGKKTTVWMDHDNASTASHIDGLRSTGFSMQLAVGISYALTDGLVIFTEPAFRRSVTSLTRGTAVNSYPSTLGLNTGILFSF